MEALTGWCELDVADAAIRGCRSTPHESALLEAIDMVRDRRALDVDVTCEDGVADDTFVAEGAQNDPGSERAARSRERFLERFAHGLCGEDEVAAERLDGFVSFRANYLTS